MFYSCCTDIRHYDLLVQNHYDAITLSASALAAMSDAAFAEAGAILSSGPIPCNSLNMYCPSALRLCGPGLKPDEVRAYADRLAGRAAALRVRCIGIGAPGSRSIPGGSDRARGVDEFCRSIADTADIFRTAGIETLLEAVCNLECNLFVTSTEMLEVVRALNRSDVGMVYDVYHAYMMSEPPENYAAVHPYVRVLHVAEDRAHTRGYLSRPHCSEFEPYFKQIRAAGFDGECAVEAFSADMEALLPTTLTAMQNLLRG